MPSRQAPILPEEVARALFWIMRLNDWKTWFFAVTVALAGCSAGTNPVDLRIVERSAEPNDALACPPNYCRAEADLTSPRYLVPADELTAAARRAIEAQSRTERVAEDAGLGQTVYVQRSALFRFPDTVRLQVVALDASSSSLALYSRSNYGYSDLGVNGRRITDWLAAIADSVGQDRVAPFSD